MRMRDHFGQLQGDRLRIRRAIPSVVDGSRHAFRIPASERIFRLGKRADIDAPHRARSAEHLLCHGQRRNDLVILDPARGKHATHMQ